MRIIGTITKTKEDNRLAFLKSEKNLYPILFTNKEFKDYKPYLDKNNIVLDIEIEDKSNILINEKDVEVYKFDHFNKISDENEVYFDIESIRSQIKEFLNSMKYKMFLDLEFSWPIPYTHMPTEIVQYGYIITDEFDNIVEKRSALVKPSRKSALNKRTLKFLNREIDDFNDAESYISFYQLLEDRIKKYDIKIIAWGRNDFLEVQQSFKLNHLSPLDIKSRFVNIMQVIKNYYQLKKEIGLFNTYKELTNNEFHEQTHDALEDAWLAKEIYCIFKKKLNEDK